MGGDVFEHPGVEKRNTRALKLMFGVRFVGNSFTSSAGFFIDRGPGDLLRSFCRLTTFFFTFLNMRRHSVLFAGVFLF